MLLLICYLLWHVLAILLHFESLLILKLHTMFIDILFAERPY